MDCFRHVSGCYKAQGACAFSLSNSCTVSASSGLYLHHFLASDADITGMMQIIRMSRDWVRFEGKAGFAPKRCS